MPPGEGQNLTPAFSKCFADNLNRAGNILLGMRHADKACFIGRWGQENPLLEAGMKERLEGSALCRRRGIIKVEYLFACEKQAEH